MIVSMWMSRNVITAEPGTLITEAAALIARKEIRRLPVVVREAGVLQLMGIVSKKDLFRADPAEVNPFSMLAGAQHRTKVTVGEVMSRHLQTTSPDAPIEEAARLMRDRKIGALPVIQNAALVGLITKSDIFRAFVELFESHRGDVRITFDASKHEDTLEEALKLAHKCGVRIVSVLTPEHEGRPLCVVRAAGESIDKFLDDLWRSGHPVLNILRMD